MGNLSSEGVKDYVTYLQGVVIGIDDKNGYVLCSMHPASLRDTEFLAPISRHFRIDDTGRLTSSWHCVETTRCPRVTNGYRLCSSSCSLTGSSTSRRPTRSLQLQL
jgi:hypothetical protein